MSLTEPQYGDLQRTFATRTPVLVLGPGCHRVGYDTTKAWKDVRRRVTLVWEEIGALQYEADNVFADVVGPRQFLRELWAAKVSVETRAEHGRALGSDLAPSIAVPEHGGDPSSRERVMPFSDQVDVDRLRTVLATFLLQALREATRCLGNVIATGASPVQAWHDVGHPGLFGGTETRSEADEANEARARAGEALKRVVEVAEVFEGLAGPNPNAVDAARADAFALPTETSDEIRKARMALKIGAVARSLRALLASRFEQPGQQITGAMIEWLGDLFWHIMVTDSRVPPSLAEMAFYVNLSEQLAPGRRTFVRARPGEGRGPLKREDLATQINGLLGTYDAGHTPWTDDVSQSRLALTRTLAATLVAMWEQTESQRYNPFAHAPLPVAIVSDYDMALERAMMEVLKPGQRMHLVLPAWRGDLERAPLIEWLWVTLARRAGKIRTEHLTNPPDDGWRRFRELGSWRDLDDPSVHGPIVVKLNGSPLMHLSAGATDQLLRPPAAGHGTKLTGPLQLATIFTEYDSLHAMVSFSATAPRDGKALASELVQSLKWDTRSWVILGDSFPDWLPRLRLLTNAESRFRSASDPGAAEGHDAPRHIAIDRAFDWPENALLNALDVTTYEANLSDLTGYPTQYTMVSDDSPAVQEFVAAVQDLLDRAQ